VTELTVVAETVAPTWVTGAPTAVVVATTAGVTV
jgi:hypothetical protein